MKVVFLINFAGKGGTETYVQMMAARLMEKGDSCMLVYNHGGPLVAQMEKLGAKTMQVGMGFPLDIGAALKIKKICGQWGADVIHTQFARENYIAIIAKLLGSKLSVIHTAHINLANNKIWKIGNILLMDQNSAVIAVCNSVKEHLVLNKYPKNRVTVIPNGYQKRDGPPVDGNRVRREFGIEKETFLFVTLTRFTPEKGIFYLLESLVELKFHMDRPFQMLIAGDGAQLDEAKAFIEENKMDYVLLAGYRTDTENILAAGDAFVNSSQSEASSFAIFEAMSSGLPVIATDVGGNPDIVNEDTGCGILVQYGDVDGMAMAMKKLATDAEFRQSCSQNAVKAVAETFNMERTFQRTYERYEEAAQEKLK